MMRNAFLCGKPWARYGPVAVGIAAQALQYGVALMMLPFVVTRLPPAEVGIWYIFVTVQGLALLSDFGFQPTIARAFASAYAGAAEIQTHGLAEEAVGDPNYLLMGRLLKAARILYLGMAVSVLMLLLTAGTAYVHHIAIGQVRDLHRVEIAWLVFACSTATYLYLTWVSPLLLGTGRITQNYLFVIASRGGFALIAIAALLLGGGLLGLAIANLVANIFARLIAQVMARPILGAIRVHDTKQQSVRSVLRALWPNAGRMGLVSVGGFLTTRWNVLVLSMFVGLAPSGSYAISLQILTALGMVAMLPTQVALPQIVGLRVQGALGGLRRLLQERVLFYLLVYVVGAAMLVLIGQGLFQLIGSKVQLLPRPLLALLAVVMLLELNHSNFAFIITTGNKVPFVRPSLLSAGAIVLFSTGAAWAGAGVLGVILSQGLVQLAYNNWKWPLTVWQELRHERV